MTLMEKVSEDMKVAMKKGEKVRLETLRMIRAQLLEKRVERRPSGEITPDDELAILIAASKKRKESIEIFTKAGRMDLADTETQELGIIGEYMPKQMSQQEVEDHIRAIISGMGEVTPRDFGKVMSAAMKDLKGKADGGLIQQIVKTILGK
jgi:uncharacterized protein YqeY